MVAVPLQGPTDPFTHALLDLFGRERQLEFEPDPR